VTIGDPGLQPQRTALAWTRTSLALFVNAALALRAGLKAHAPVLMALGVVLLVASAAGVACGAWRREQLRRLDAPAAPHHGLLLAAVVACWLAVLTGLLAVALH
jgi:uncharacterized membrane protein YidH (DUF202 family)